MSPYSRRSSILLKIFSTGVMGTREHYMLVIGSRLVYELALLAGSIYLGGWFYSIGISSVTLVPKFHV